jgi:hypothetical protein
MGRRCRTSAQAAEERKAWVARGSTLRDVDGKD